MVTQDWLQVASTGGFPLLTLLTLLPTAFAVVALLIPGDQPWAHKALGLCGSVAVLLVALVTFGAVDTSVVGLQRVDDFSWISAVNARWTLGIDGLSLPYILLTAGLTPLVFVGAWSAIEVRWKEFTIALLVLETGMLGSLLATDLLAFYTFWEVMLVPMYLIIGIWGGKDRIYATVKFFIYTMFGSLLMLVAILYLYHKAGGSFALHDLAAVASHLTDKEQSLLFGAFALAFLIKVPAFPFHTWLPDAHTEAPTPGSVILAGVLLKLGTYGLLRFAVPLFPTAFSRYSWVFVTLAVIGIVFGAMMAYVQTDVKRLVAYSSVSHLGFVILGITAFNEAALQGAILQGVNHGLSTGALFLLVGFLYERRHTREISEFGGIAKKMPVYAAFFVFITMSSIALPLTNGFVGEFLIFAGAFKEGLGSAMLGTWSSWRNIMLIGTGIGTLGIVLGAVYMLSMVRRVFFGEITKADNNRLHDLTLRERMIVGILAVFILWIGVKPAGWLKLSETTVHAMVAQTRPQVLQVRSPMDFQQEQKDALAHAQPPAAAVEN